MQAIDLRKMKLQGFAVNSTAFADNTFQGATAGIAMARK
jgi:hypothetical protein